MSSAGQQLVAGRIPGERIATTTETADSSTFTAETVVSTVVAPLVSGRTYRVRAIGRAASTVDNDDALSRIREDSISGTTLQLDGVELSLDAQGTTGQLFVLECQYTAVSTGNKTFVVTLVRQAGTGNLKLRASSDRPTLFYVDYLSG